MTLGDAIAAFGEQLWNLVPLRVVSAWQQGARVRAGDVRGPLTHTNGIRGTGVHAFVPFLDEIHILDSSIEVAEAPTQTCTTKDGQDVTYALVVRYRVSDAAQLFRTIFEGASTAVTQAMGSAGELSATLDSDEFAEKIGDAVYGDIAGRLEEWGIQLEDVQLSTCVFARTFRLIGDTPRRVKTTLEVE